MEGCGLDCIYPNEINVPNSSFTENEIVEWCTSCCKGKWGWYWFDILLVMTFEDKEDLALFKLTWC